MSSIGIRDLSRNTSKVVEEVTATRRPALVTNHGKLVAALIPVDEAAIEDWVLATAPQFVEDRAAAEREYAAGETTTLSEFLEELDDEDDKG